MSPNSLDDDRSDARGFGDRTDVARAVRELLAATHAVEADEWASLLESGFLEGNGIKPVAWPIIVALVPAVPHARSETRVRIVEAIAFIASREPVPGDDTSQRCLRLVAGAHRVWVDLLASARTSDELYVYIDVLGICPAGDVGLYEPVLAQLRALLARTDLAGLDDTVAPMLRNTVEGLEALWPIDVALAAARERLARLESS